ncbi:MAG: hypothetical protein IIA09_16360 [Proteobacteria bacterium]|nr:hypothetical protein [Pseudomonadota bacterium]
MSNKCVHNESPVTALKDESARQRWELFHRAIAHAKQSNVSAMQDTDSDAGEAKRPGPTLSIVR